MADRGWSGWAAAMAVLSAAACRPSPSNVAEVPTALNQVTVANEAPPHLRRRLSTTGSAGPFKRVTVTASLTGELPAPRLLATAEIEGRHILLGRPDDPAGFFIHEPTAILFAPVQGVPSNAIIILYNSSQVGPGHGTDRLALVYRLDQSGAERLREVEATLEGVGTPEEARQRLEVLQGS